MRRLIVGTLVILLAASGGGCASGPRTVVTYPSAGGGGGAQLMPAADPGFYTLHPRQADGRLASQVECARLAAGDALGFARGAGGRLYAVAGSKRTPLAEGRYDWQYLPPDRPNPVADALEAAMLLPAVGLFLVIYAIAPGALPTC